MFIAAISHHVICLPQMFWLIWGFPRKLLSLLPVFSHNPCCVVVFSRTCPCTDAVWGITGNTKRTMSSSVLGSYLSSTPTHNVQRWIRAHGLKYKEEKKFFFHPKFGFQKVTHGAKSHTYQNLAQLKVTHIKKSRTEPLWYLPTHTAMKI